MVTSVDKCDQLSILKQHPTQRESEYRLGLGIVGRGSPRLCVRGCNGTQVVSGQDSECRVGPGEHQTQGIACALNSLEVGCVTASILPALSVVA